MSRGPQEKREKSCDGEEKKEAKKKQFERKRCNIGTRSGHITMVLKIYLYRCTEFGPFTRRRHKRVLPLNTSFPILIQRKEAKSTRILHVKHQFLERRHRTVTLMQRKT